MSASLLSPPDLAALHLRPNVWSKVNALHVRKAISELAHELLLKPELQYSEDGWGHYTLATDNPSIRYRFRAQVLGMDHWHIDQTSIAKFENEKPVPLDALGFIVEVSGILGISPAVLPSYMEEITSTLYGSAYKHAKESPTAAQLTQAAFQDVEAAMMEGHPAFLANNGRIGFDAIDYRAYAPEAATPVTLIWLAAHKSKATFASIDGLTYDALMQDELDGGTRDYFTQKLQREGLDPADYLFMPAHPWQWFNKLASIFAPDIAARHLVCLGYSDDEYRAQQSIRTFFNMSHPRKRYVKTSLSVLNMGFVRGLSPYYMSTTPAINQWIDQLLKGDPYLTACGFSILREVASMGYRNQYYETAVKGDTYYKKMLAALWRESPVPQLQAGQRMMTMASLLHVDQHGTALLPELIKSSGLDITTWLRHYLKRYLSPLLHCFYMHDLVFMPHGENLILVLENNVPVRAIMKDIAEECAILNNSEVVLPEKARRILVTVPEELKILSIFTDVFDLIFRYISCILLEHAQYPEQRFWQLVAECLVEYQRAHPKLAAKFQRYDLFAPEFIRSCVNRLQLGNNQQMIDLADPAKSLKFAGTIKNPIAVLKASVRESLAASA